ncbi:MAG: histidine kinase dimerization/phospho-acceptor domain-containing protein [Bacteroidota bacterium]
MLVFFRGSDAPPLHDGAPRNPLVSFLTAFYRTVRDFFVQYPAALSGYVIYGYLFVSTIKFFIDEKQNSLGAFDTFLRFDAVLWMWFLALALVKIIEIRTKLYNRETTELMQQQELKVKEMQLTTLRQTVLGLQHEVNNPLTIIIMTAGKLERQLGYHKELLEGVKTIRAASERMARTLNAFSRAKQYEVDNTPIGQIAKPPELTEND